MTFSSLRKKHPRFVYERYEYRFVKGALEMQFRFCMSPDIVFSPTLVIEGVGEEAVARIGRPAFDNFVFHMGLAEIPSYWKSACPKEIVVACGPLDASQKAWWRSLILNGLGEFLYTHRIDFTAPGFLHITAPSSSPRASARGDAVNRAPRMDAPLDSTVIVPLGGGKDSLVTAELLRQGGVPFRPLIMGTAPVLRRVATAVHGGTPIVVRRRIDPTLLALNKKGYLNGHTPFSAYLAFLTVFSAALFGHRTIAISQERSANEANVVYKGHPINHQYSKSFAFEKRFRAYAGRYLAPDVAFWSAVRPLYELQIAEMFADMPRYHAAFRSCNVGAKRDVWCGKCPKCITIYALLSPFLPREAMVRIVGRDVFADASLWPVARALLGKTKRKPFECVGTKGEMAIALSLSVARYRKEGRPLPAMLRRFTKEMGPDSRRAFARAGRFLASWDKRNATPPWFAKLLRAADRISDRPKA